MYSSELVFQTTAELKSSLDKVDNLEGTIPHDVDENLSSLRLFLSENSLIQDELLRIEKDFRHDIGMMKELVKNAKSEYKFEYNQKLVSLKHDKSPLDRKKAEAEIDLNPLTVKINGYENWLEILSQGLEYLSNKKSEVRQKNFDVKALYRGYLETRPRSYDPAPDVYSMKNNPFKRDPFMEDATV